MPIRFRCAYCNQLMGIAKRKAGTVVRCPSCAGQVLVPNPDDESPSAEVEAPLFERTETDQVIILSTRPSMPPGDVFEALGPDCAKGGSIDFVWIVWQQGRDCRSPARIVWR